MNRLSLSFPNKFCLCSIFLYSVSVWHEIVLLQSQKEYETSANTHGKNCCYLTQYNLISVGSRLGKFWKNWWRSFRMFGSKNTLVRHHFRRNFICFFKIFNWIKSEKTKDFWYIIWFWIFWVFPNAISTYISQVQINLDLKNCNLKKIGQPNPDTEQCLLILAGASPPHTLTWHSTVFAEPSMQGLHSRNPCIGNICYRH